MARLKFTHRLIPLRLARGNDSSIDVVFQIENLTDKEMLLSIEGKLPKNALLGFDPNLVHKRAMKKLGTLEPGEYVEASLRVYGARQTKPGDYPILLIVNEHYQDYTKVLEEYKRMGTIRVI